MPKTVVVNLFGGPGTGKSTAASGIFSLLKLHGVNCEYVPEFAKDLTWEERRKTLGNQVYVFGKQYHRLWRLKGQVDVIITDSPLFLGIIYDENIKVCFTETIIDKMNEFDNMNYFLKREKLYNPKGRNQTEEEAKKIDISILNHLEQLRIPYHIYSGNHDGINKIVSDIMGIKLNYPMECPMYRINYYPNLVG